MKWLLLLTAWATLTATAPAGDSSPQPLFDLSSANATREWQTVNDGVMGGRSDGKFRVTDNNTLLFYGNLSLANNGGFASVRSRSNDLKLTRGDVLLLKVKGDGRKYNMNLYPTRRRTAFAYRAEFSTKKDEWTNVRLPLSEFEATSFGRRLPNVTLDPADISGLGILLGDKKAGPFQLEVAAISVERN